MWQSLILMSLNCTRLYSTVQGSTHCKVVHSTLYKVILTSVQKGIGDVAVLDSH